MKHKNVKYIAAALMAAFIICSLAAPVSAKTLTNQDIRQMQRGINRGIPTYQGGGVTKSPAKTTSAPANGLKGNPSSGIPAVPEVDGGNAALVPPPQGMGTGGVPLVKKPLPYSGWEDEYKEYFSQYYHDQSTALKPKLIVLHYSATDSLEQLWWTFVNGGKYDGKPGHLSTHYAVDRDGSIYELIPPSHKARNTYGVNHAAIQIDIIGKNENQIMGNKKQMSSTFGLVRWLMKRYKLPKEKVLGHFEIAKGKEIVPEYTDFVDKSSPNKYPPNAKTRGPGKAYMFKLRYFLMETK